MINKQNLWFLTLFSLVLVLSVYYVTMPDELLLKEDVLKASESVISVKEEDDLLVSLKLEEEENRRSLKKEIDDILTSKTATVYEKNEAYEKLINLNSVYGMEEKLENKIKEEFNLDCVIEIDNNEINVVVLSKEHDMHLANNIMRCIQNEYDSKVYVTVNFK